jgi:hypothetical protein
MWAHILYVSEKKKILHTYLYMNVSCSHTEIRCKPFPIENMEAIVAQSNAMSYHHFMPKIDIAFKIIIE